MTPKGLLNYRANAHLLLGLDKAAVSSAFLSARSSCFGTGFLGEICCLVDATGGVDGFGASTTTPGGGLATLTADGGGGLTAARPVSSFLFSAVLALSSVADGGSSVVFVVVVVVVAACPLFAVFLAGRRLGLWCFCCEVLVVVSNVAREKRWKSKCKIYEKE